MKNPDLLSANDNLYIYYPNNFELLKISQTYKFKIYFFLNKNKNQTI